MADGNVRSCTQGQRVRHRREHGTPARIMNAVLADFGLAARYLAPQGRGSETAWTACRPFGGVGPRPATIIPPLRAAEHRPKRVGLPDVAGPNSRRLVAGFPSCELVSRGVCLTLSTRPLASLSRFPSLRLPRRPKLASTSMLTRRLPGWPRSSGRRGPCRTPPPRCSAPRPAGRGTRRRRRLSTSGPGSGPSSPCRTPSGDGWVAAACRARPTGAGQGAERPRARRRVRQLASTPTGPGRRTGSPPMTGLRHASVAAAPGDSPPQQRHRQAE